MSTIFYRQELSGGGVLALDAVPSLTPLPGGASLTTGDLSLTAHTDGKIYAHKFVAALTTIESSPAVIAPDDGGAGRWILQQSPFDTSPMPAGAIVAWPTETPPGGFLECMGAAVSRLTYANLFAVIGTTYGVGDGVNTFNLPDYQGEFLRGWNHGTGKDPDAASRTTRGDGTTGDHVGTKQAGQFASHTHSGTWRYDNASVQVTTGSGTGIGGSTKNVSSTGGNETRPRNVNVLYCIKY